VIEPVRRSLTRLVICGAETGVCVKTQSTSIIKTPNHRLHLSIDQTSILSKYQLQHHKQPYLQPIYVI
jgi:hypothetical protein